MCAGRRGSGRVRLGSWRWGAGWGAVNTQDRSGGDGEGAQGYSEPRRGWGGALGGLILQGTGRGS